MLKNLTTKLNQNKKKKKGFTLIELIIVIAIIAILSAIAIPKFMDVKSGADVKADIANAKNIESAITMALANDKISLPASTTTVAEPVALSAIMQTVPKGKKTTGDFKATLDKDGKIVISIGSGSGNTATSVVVLGDGVQAPYVQ